MFGLFGYPVMTSFKSELWDGTANYLILAGGGGGGGVIDGGGGAGGYRTSWGTGTDGTGGNSGGLSSLETALIMTSGTAYSITVGQGGQGGLGWNSSANLRGHKGRTSSISGSDITTVTTVGGGGGKGFNYTGSTERDGGSGGGGAYPAAGGSRHGSGTTGEGFSGGTVTVDVGGGGGGAGGAGAGSTSTASAGDGGVGLASTITGTLVSRAGGGGGGIRASSGTDNGIGVAGGGDGGVNSVTRLSYGTVTTVAATSGRPQYGGGGGGAGYNAASSTISTGGNGGSGNVILRLPKEANYNATKLAHDVSSASNCTASYLNTRVYTADANFGDVVLLMDGTSTTTDLSIQNQTVTETGSDTALSNETDPFGNTVDVLDFNRAAGTAITGIQVSNSPIPFGNSPFTIEMFVKLDALDDAQFLYSDRTSDASKTFVLFRVESSGKLRFFKDSVVGGNLEGTTVLSAGTWYHVALTYDGSTIRMFVDGDEDATSTQSLTFNSNVNPVLGYDPSSTSSAANYYAGQLTGQMTQVRVTKGVARYTANFTPPTSALPNPTMTGGDHVISFNVATETSHPGDASNNDGTITWTPIMSPRSVISGSEFLLVGGGGGGGQGSVGPGGGGAGGMVVGTNQSLLTGNSYSVVIGAGGVTQSNGANSTFNFNSLTATGGGRGGAWYAYNNVDAGQSGGSGGGGASGAGTGTKAGGSGNQNSYPSLTNITGYGNNGANASQYNGGYFASGGGGAGGNGTSGSGSNHTAGNGGAGEQWAVDLQYYAGGGGGNAYIPNAEGGTATGGNGGTGGGGTGRLRQQNSINNREATPGTVNTGGGGGGGESGGSGVFKIWIPVANYTSYVLGSELTESATQQVTYNSVDGTLITITASTGTSTNTITFQ
tara:strand:+ start:11047 stop:13710 length:2664 start_codon:yes stop_codon:yes gene_type:complete